MADDEEDEEDEDAADELGRLLLEDFSAEISTHGLRSVRLSVFCGPNGEINN